MVEECYTCGKPSVGMGVVEGTRVALCERCAQYAGGFAFYRKEAPKKSVSAENSFKQGVATSVRSSQARETDFVVNFGKVLFQAREKLGLSRKQLGEKLFIREHELAAFEEERLKPIEAIAKKLERFLGIKILEEQEIDVHAIAEESKTRRGQPTLADVVEIKKK
jgi:putative transcription factor